MRNLKGTRLRLYKFRGGFLAKLRAFWWTIIRNHDGELCYDCGRPYELWWCTSSELWSRVTGYATNGLCCPRCFDRRAERHGIVIEWNPRVFRERGLS